MTARTAALAAAFAIVAGCARNPVTGKRQLSLVSTKEEIQLGQQAAQEVQQSIGRYSDPKVQAYVEGIGKRIAAKTERPDLPWSFTVLDDPTVNAFALPGGPVFITRGILTYLNSEAELASVLGHEIGHITARHSVQDISKAQLAQLGLGIGAILSPDVAQLAQAAGAGIQLLFLRFSRDHERQADELGFRYMTAQGYDPREMAHVFTTLDRTSKVEGQGKLPQWLSTHPDPGDRAETAAKRASGVTDAAQRKAGRDEYLAHVGGMTFGDDPRQGFFQGTAFLHPNMKFRIDFPQGWTTANTAGAVMAQSPKKDAILKLEVAGKISPEEATKKFFAQKGVQPANLTGGGPLPAGARYFVAQTDQGQVGGLVAFFSHEGTTLGLVGYTPAANVPTYAPAFQASLASFRPLTDPAALSVQPRRVELVKVPREMTLAEFNAQFPSTVPIETVAIMNEVATDGRLEAGRTMKRVVGGGVPKS